MTGYNTYYKEEESYFGEPYEGFIDFFSDKKLGNSVLDLGCGQGRDSLALGRLGYTVMGIDNSKVGIEQLIDVSKKEKLNVLGLVGDVYDCKLIPDYDIILLDSMFHFYKNDKDKEVDFLNSTLVSIKKGGVVCIMILKSSINEEIVSSILNKNNFLQIEDKYLDYKKFNCEYRMFVYKK